MPHVRLRLPALKPGTHPDASPVMPPGGRLLGFVLALMGIALLASAAEPLLAGAQADERSGWVHDPGVRGGPPAAGGPLAGATANELAVFATSRGVFKEIDSVSGAPIDGASGSGLGPRFNLDSCAGCHAFPEVGGTSPTTNPQALDAVVHRGGATNSADLSGIISLNGPVREVRFKTNRDGTPDGGVHDLFTIAGRTDAPGCRLTQPDFKTALATNNAIFRIPTPVFGAGLIESISDQTILDNQTADADRKRVVGIAGRVNRESNAGTITRFGWKAQNKSLQIFAGEAYNVEQGVTNQIFPDERDATQGCQFNATPEDHSTFTVQNGSLVAAADDTISFRLFMRLLAPPTPQTNTGGAALASSIQNGRNQFGAVGCALCHTPTLTTGLASSPDAGVASSSALSHKDANLYSDLLIHNMGSGLADGIAQGSASGSEFRSAPLWGIGQRIFLLHDGRTSDLLEAIQAHASDGSEANRVIGAFNSLPRSQQQDILNFLRSL